MNSKRVIQSESRICEPYSVVEAARRSGLSERYLREAIRNREFPVVRYGRKLVIMPEALEAWIASKTVPAFDARKVARDMLDQ